jgi:hypothetical protein
MKSASKEFEDDLDSGQSRKFQFSFDETIVLGRK